MRRGQYYIRRDERGATKEAIVRDTRWRVIAHCHEESTRALGEDLAPDDIVGTVLGGRWSRNGLLLSPIGRYYGSAALGGLEGK